MVHSSDEYNHPSDFFEVNDDGHDYDWDDELYEPPVYQPPRDADAEEHRRWEKARYA